MFGLRLTNGLGPQALRTLGTSAQLSSRSWHVNAAWNSHPMMADKPWAKNMCKSCVKTPLTALSPKYSSELLRLLRWKGLPEHGLKILKFKKLLRPLDAQIEIETAEQQLADRFKNSKAVPANVMMSHEINEIHWNPISGMSYHVARGSCICFCPSSSSMSC